MISLIVVITALPGSVMAENASATTSSDEVILEIDNENVYEGMNESYSDGYIPTVEDGYARIIVPLICTTGEINEEKIKAQVDTGSSSETPQGQYNINVQMEYADYKGATYTSSVNAKINVVQAVNVEFDSLSLPDEAKVGKTIQLEMSALNLGRGKVYNVRGIIECDGLDPAGTIFIGDMEAGSIGQASTTAVVTSLSESSTGYGIGKGTVHYYYEDGLGNEYESIENVEISVTSPFTEKTDDEEDDPSHWWIIVAVLLGILVIMSGVPMVRKYLK